MDASIRQCRYLLKEADTILSGLDDSHRALEPKPGTKTSGWLIGHLVVTGDFARKLCGRKAICPVEWRPLFNPGSTPSTDAATYPSMTELTTAFRDVYADLCDAAARADPETLNAANPYTSARASFPTAGDFAGYLMAGHLGYHLGQVSAWRAAAGFAPRAARD